MAKKHSNYKNTPPAATSVVDENINVEAVAETVEVVQDTASVEAVSEPVSVESVEAVSDLADVQVTSMPVVTTAPEPVVDAPEEVDAKAAEEPKIPITNATIVYGQTCSLNEAQKIANRVLDRGGIADVYILGESGNYWTVQSNVPTYAEAIKVSRVVKSKGVFVKKILRPEA